MLVIGILLSFTACGYHLRGSVGAVPLAAQSIFIEGAGGQLQQMLNSTLKNADATIVASADQADLHIQVSRDELRRRVLSLDDNGKAIEFELNYSLDYALLDNQGKKLSPKQSIEINRDFFNDQEDILAKNNEENVIREEIYRQAVRAIITKASAVLKH